MDELYLTLNNIGLEVEDIIDRSEGLGVFKSVLVEECEKHPNSDHLHVCKVKTHEGNVLQIVCGAPNVKKGMKSILAPVGSVIPDGEMKIKKAKIRGVESEGMLCSGKELGLDNNPTGIIELDKKVKLGKSVVEIFGLNDPLIDISITPNRGDCLGVYGVARDLAAAGLGKLKKLYVPEIKATVPCPVKLDVTDKNCTCFGIRYIKGVKNCESPDWMKQKLISIGLTPKSALVDITNYVMFCINKPLHCYDASKISGNMVIRTAEEGEKFVALDDKEYELTDKMTVIADEKEVLCLGGIIGGLSSASTMETTDVILESALFDSVNTRRSGKGLGIETDSRFRFERKVDPEDLDRSLNIAAHLIMDICGGECSEIVKVCTCEEKCNFKRTLNYELSRTKKLLGIEIPRMEIIEILKNLGFEVKENSKDLNILHLTIPTWRNDVGIQEDIVEEIIRIYGYNKLAPAKISSKKIGENIGNIQNKEFYSKLWQMRVLLASKGMDEIISWSFLNENIAKEFAPINDKLRLLNPISLEMAYMRPSLIPNMMTILKKNEDRGFDNLGLFEKGRIFVSNEPEAQKRVIAGVRYGQNTEKDVHGSSRKFDVFDVKSDLYDCLKIFGIKENKVTLSNDVPDYYHPGKSGAIKLGETYIGCFGEIHPLKTKLFDLKGRVYAFELFLDNLPQKVKKKGVRRKVFSVNDLQISKRDFAFWVDKDVEVGKILDFVKDMNRETIKSIHLFDIYEGKDDDKKSVAFSITIQPQDKTMTGDEIEAICQDVIKGVEKGFDGELRKE